MGVKVEEQWRYKRKQSELASRSAFTFKINKELKQKSAAKMSYGYGNVIPYTKGVILKITGGARSKKGIKNGVEYISKNWKEEIIDSAGIKYKRKEEMQDAIRRLQAKVPESVKYDPTKPEKLTHNMIFSASILAGVKKEDMVQATIKALKEKYPDNYFVAAYHDDTKKPHVHVVMNIHDNTGRKIDIKNKDFHQIRRSFCQKLVEYGYDVKASRKYEDGKYNLEQKDYEELKRENRNIYQVVEFGNASYKLDRKSNENSYLIYKTANNEKVTIWGKELLNEIMSNDIKRGDFVKIKKTGEIDVKVPVFGKDSKTIISWKSAKRNQWCIERAENKIEQKLELHNDTNNTKIKQNINKDKRVIKLDSPERREKQLVQRQKFEHEKKLAIDPKYREEFELKQKLEHQLKHKRKFSW